MPQFLAETYAPRDAAGAGVPSDGDITRAADQASGPGAPVRFLGAIAVPGEETCFGLYQAPTADAVRAAMAAAGLRPERITRAVPIGPQALPLDTTGTAPGWAAAPGLPHR